MNDFFKDDYVIINNAISKDVCKLLAKEFRISRDIAMYTNKNNPNAKHPSSKQDAYPFEDEMVSNSFSWYSPLCFEALSESFIKDIVEEVVKEKVYPTYSYARIYYKGSKMYKHIDRTSSEFSVSVCIEDDISVDPWPLQVESKEKEVIKVYQKPGDLILYRGNNLFHWRSKFLGHEHISAFMFFVRQNSNKSDLKYDTRPLLGLNANTRILNSEQQVEKYGIS